MFLLMTHRPPSSKRTDSHFPYTTLVRSPVLLARIIVVERQHHVFGWMPLQRDAAVDAFVLGVDLRGAILLFEEAGDRFVREFRIGARRCDRKSTSMYSCNICAARMPRYA